MPITHRRRNSAVELSRVGGVNAPVGSRDPVYNFLCSWAIEVGDKWRHNDVIVEKVISIDQNSRNQTTIWSVSKLSTESVVSRRGLVANCVYTHRRRRRDSTRQLRPVGVGRVYLALVWRQKKHPAWKNTVHSSKHWPTPTVGLYFGDDIDLAAVLAVSFVVRCLASNDRLPSQTRNRRTNFNSDFNWRNRRYIHELVYTFMCFFRLSVLCFFSMMLSLNDPFSISVPCFVTMRPLCMIFAAFVSFFFFS